MKKYITTLVLLLNIFYNINAQQFADKEFYLVDSLVLEDLNESDKVLIDSVLNIYHKEQNILIRFKHIENLIDNCWDDSVWPMYNFFLLSETERLEKNDNKHLKEGFLSFKGVAYGNIAYSFDIQGKNDSALKYYKIAEQVFTECNNEQKKGEIQNAVSQVYSNKGDILKALTIGEKSLETLNEKFLKTAYCYQNVGLLHYKQDNNEEALYFFEKAIDIASKHNDFALKAHIKAISAKILLEQNNFELAENVALNALKIVQENENLNGAYIHLQILNALSNIFFEKESYDFSKTYADDLLSISLELSNEFYKNKAKLILSKLSVKDKEYKSAKQFAIDSYMYGKKEKDAYLTTRSLMVLADCERFLNNYLKANEYLFEYIELKNKITNEETKKASLKQAIKYQYKKQKEIDDLKNKQTLALEAEKREKQQVLLIATILGLFVFAGLLAFIFNRLQLIRKQKTELNNAYIQLEESKKNELAVSNLKALQSQMNPHFIFNALNSVQDLVLLKDIRNSNKFLGKFSDLIRKILLSSKEQFISLEEEIEILTLYLDLEKLRFGDEFVVNFSCNVPKQKQAEIELPAMFIQPYIENAIKHGLFHKQGKKILKVDFSLVNSNKLQCIVEDNGVGQKQAAIFKEKRLHLHTGFSTEAINERIHLLNQTLNEKIDLQTIDLENDGETLGTKVVILFPV